MNPTVLNILKKTGIGIALFIITTGASFGLTWGFYQLTNQPTTAQKAASSSSAAASSKAASLKITDKSSTTSAKSSSKASSKASSTGNSYLVKAGDTGASIAAAHGLTLEELTALNPSITWTALKAGETISIGSATAAEETSAASSSAKASKNYVVQSGDTWYRIAYNNNMTTAQLKALNPGVEDLQAGATIKIGE